MARPPRQDDTTKTGTSRTGPAAQAADDAARAARAQQDTSEIVRPMATMILADVALRAGQTLVRRGVLGGLLGRQVAKAASKKSGRIIKGRTIGHTLVGTALARVATSSVPGAIVVGGGLLAKTLYDRRQAKAAKARADAAAATAKIPVHED
ncbi:hypothetical protein [Novosphingobium sp. FKTRR1]|uniref:hypothetical protein n=1 Tax=Novosphingobium sp. FKTRR1 TaxID=2879118 RepID=UPI001CF040BF|nr:hypothetical protein [Novosphingobium sp. FKTRR1]